MPAYYEMMISHSPPVFSHSPPSSFLSEFVAKNFMSCRPQMISTLQSRKSFPPPVEIKSYGTRAPKSCLMRNKNEPKFQENNINQRSKKKVVFADDQGFALTQVRVMSEPSNVPPFWSLKFLAQITQGLVSPHPSEQWTVDFRQPASDYLQFRQKIESQFVSLENVIVKENESIIVGTVKVKNISFQKEVIVRVTWDNWKNQQDIFCTYSEIYGPSSAYVIFDTFSFKITLPPSSKKLEFCICFRVKDREYWDNNDGTNYTISKRSPSGYQLSANALLPYEKISKGITQTVNISSETKPISIPPPMGKAIWSDESTWNEDECQRRYY